MLIEIFKYLLFSKYLPFSISVNYLEVKEEAFSVVSLSQPKSRGFIDYRKNN